MNDDYLWDKSGEPDPQIKELEEILLPLRYQPKPLDLPVVAPRRNYVPFAIAATILIALLISGIWLRLRKEKSTPPQEQAQAIPSIPSVPSVPSVVKEEGENTDSPKKPVRRHNQRVSKPTFTKHDREEALAAKEQVMLALRLASEKIKLAQQKTLSPSPNQIKNQHRIG